MEHVYQSRKKDISEISEGLSLIETVLAVNAASSENMKRIMKREDTLIDDEALRECVLKYASCLGLLIRMIEPTAVCHDACTVDELTGTVETAWRERLNGCAHLDDRTTSVLERVASALRHERDVILAYEGYEDGSSSPSDYSDSDSPSSDMEQDVDEEETDEEEEEEQSAPSRRNRR